MFLRQRSGFSIAQVLVGTVVVIGLALATLAGLGSLQKNQNRSAASSSRDSVASILEFNASTPLSLYLSSEYASNTLSDHRMTACMCGESTCTDGTSADFNLLDVGSAILAGTVTGRQRFNLLGNYCQNPPCVFEGDAQFSCVGSGCGTYTMTNGNPLFRISYNVRLTGPAKGRYSEFSYLKDLSSAVNVPISAVRRYGLLNDICVSGTSVSPGYGLAWGGTSVTISGTGLQKVTSVVFGGGATCSITSRTSKVIHCTTSPHPDGYVDVALNYAPGQSFVMPNAFEYYTPPPPPPPPPPPSGPPSGPTCYWVDVSHPPVACFGPSQVTPPPPGPCSCGDTYRSACHDFSCQ